MTVFRIILLGVFSCLGVYLFATAPPPLLDGAAENPGCRHPVNALFDGVNAINHSARAVYTERIVGGGLKAGLKFGEDWQQPGVEQGPLPALFLRATAAELEAMPPLLGLYLGSDAPINKSNLFAEGQQSTFEQLKRTRQPVFSEDAQIGFVAMYPDVAGVAPCVSCHNEHPDSPKADWKLNDVMGATTWTFPDPDLSADQYLGTVSAMYLAVQRTYESYLEKARVFDKPVPVGEIWPDSGERALPTVEVFLNEVKARSSSAVMQAIMQDRGDPQDASVAGRLALGATEGLVPCAM